MKPLDATLATQEAQIKGYCMMKGWQPPTLFIERSVSGSSPLTERPQGQKLLAALQRFAAGSTSRR
jgi:putative DNA-invertase from lambdoid prophage Rac